MKKIEVVAKKQDRILKILERECQTVIYSALVKALRQKDVIVNGARVKENIVVPAGSSIVVYVDDSSEKKNMFEIVYEDDNVVFINKSSGIETCDGVYNVVDECLKQNKVIFPVHRLDRNTKGLLVFAKTVEVQNELIAQFKKGNVAKLYYAEVYGTPEQKHKVLKGYLEKNKDESSVKIYNSKKPNSSEITTEYSVIKSSGNTSLLSVKIKEGKTHQIR
ncbi:MAG: RluA family pseudouridine synthase, partial [Clostridia bacterium]|nr:RluA family pseudouridine synthase [Clostridia bacterium]